jgi:pyruvate dehydrogenase E1 component alpha subunit
VGDPEKYRQPGEVSVWQTRDKDPIQRFEKRLVELNLLTENKIGEMRAAVKKEIDEAVLFADQSPIPDPAELYADVYAQ